MLPAAVVHFEEGTQSARFGSHDHLMEVVSKMKNKKQEKNWERRKDHLFPKPLPPQLYGLEERPLTAGLSASAAVGSRAPPGRGLVRCNLIGAQGGVWLLQQAVDSF